jgi:hypothetical protein
MSTYINDSKDALERHIGKEHEESPLIVADILEFVSLSLKDQRNQSGNKLQINRVIMLLLMQIGY